MKTKQRTKTILDTNSTITAHFLRALSSGWFSKLIIVLITLQGLWFAASFTFPIVFDESYHYEIIEVYTHQFGPIIYDQPTSLDHLRDLEDETSFLYHYLMSFFLRFVNAFTNDFSLEVIALRSINVMFVAASYIFFIKTFLRAGVRRLYINIGLLFFSLIPIVPYVAGTINYDNMLLLATSLYLYVCVRLIAPDNSTNYWTTSSLVVITGLFASLVKFTFLPIFLASVFFLVVHLYRSIGLQAYLKNVAWSLRRTKYVISGVLIVAIFVLTGLFSAIYLKNVIVYGTPKPSCTKTLGEDRCLSSPIIQRNYNARQNSGNKEAVNLFTFSSNWTQTMIAGLTSVNVARTSGGIGRYEPLPIMRTAVGFGIVLLVGVILLAWRGLSRSDSLRFLLFVAFINIAAIFMKNLDIYYDLHGAYATQARYLFISLLIFLIYGAVSFGSLLGRRKTLGVGIFVIVLIILTQGGGALSYAVKSQSSWFWEDYSWLRTANTEIKDVSSKFIKESYGEFGF